eukprot:338185_1
MCSSNKSSDISYEFNTNGFYNALSDQLQEIESILQKVSSTASNRLHTKRVEYNQLISSNQNQNNNKHISNSIKQEQLKQEYNTNKMQLVKFKNKNKIQSEFIGDNIEEKDWSKFQLSNLYTKDTSNNTMQKKHIQPKISPIASFINTDFFPNEIENKDISIHNNKKELNQAKKEFMTQCTGDNVVDSLLLRLSAHMTI